MCLFRQSALTHLEEEDEIDMCKAIEDMRFEAEAKGREEGRAEGNTERILTDLKNVMDSINVSIEEAMDILKIDPLKRQDYAARIK